MAALLNSSHPNKQFCLANKCVRLAKRKEGGVFSTFLFFLQKPLDRVTPGRMQWRAASARRSREVRGSGYTYLSGLVPCSCHPLPS